MVAICSSCGFELNLEADVQQCSNCGAATVAAPAAVAHVVINDAVEVTVGYSDEQSWLTKWDDVKRDMEAVDDAFSDTDVDNLIIKHRLVRFFEDCWHLVEWLGRDAQVSGIDHKYVLNAALASRAMKVCEAVANTSKHHTRHAGLPTALVKSVTLTHQTPTAQIKYSEGNSNIDFDAQSSATECVAWWRQFFVDNGIVAP